ncbi:hypothetical protein J6590_066000 [Homalodisca vitripennis]|nr:hypothetical protein J6590_066000 [Homalodisca vitripennis]
MNMENGIKVGLRLKIKMDFRMVIGKSPEVGKVFFPTSSWWEPAVVRPAGPEGPAGARKVEPIVTHVWIVPCLTTCGRSHY